MKCNISTLFLFSALFWLFGLLGPVSAAPAVGRYRSARSAVQERSTVKVEYPEGTVTGISLDGVESFQGIPFAQPPVGNLRLRPPRRLDSSSGLGGDVDGTGIGPSCPQMLLSVSSGSPVTQFLGTLIDLPLFQEVTNTQEDCLTIRIQRPAGTTASSKLPVLFWIFGGGFELGSSSMYDGSGLVTMGIDLGQPFVFVAVNYRVAGFGFLGGKEILADGAANLGLLDQRLGLEWVADNIAAFGGDPAKVTIWGESAGAISVFDQMALYGGKNHTYRGQPLFRAAIMDSGSLVPAEPVDGPKAQAIYDSVVAEAGCANAATGTLACLRSVSYDTLLAAVNSVPGILSYNSIALSYVPRPDGVILPMSPNLLAASGAYAAVPMIIGDQEDEGTLFSLFQSNVTSSTAGIVTYLSSLFFHQATTAQLTALVQTYSTSISAGSPFRTGIFNELYPGFKRLAAILGDLVFTLTRRLFLTTTATVNPTVPSWSYLSSYDYGTPYLGTFHASDLLQVFYGVLPNHASRSIQTYYINFLTNLDPNVGATSTSDGDLTYWPQWASKHQLMQFFNSYSAIITDDFRQSSYQVLVANAASYLI